MMLPDDIMQQACPTNLASVLMYPAFSTVLSIHPEGVSNQKWLGMTLRLRKSTVQLQ